MIVYQDNKGIIKKKIAKEQKKKTCIGVRSDDDAKPPYLIKMQTRSNIKKKLLALSLFVYFLWNEYLAVCARKNFFFVFCFGTGRSKLLDRRNGVKFLSKRAKLLICGWKPFEYNVWWKIEWQSKIYIAAHWETEEIFFLLRRSGEKFMAWNTLF